MYSHLFSSTLCIPGDAPEKRESSEKSKKSDKEKFDLADTNKDGKLSYYELGVMIHPNEASQMSSIIVAVCM